jgi:hypothetical protein
MPRLVFGPDERDGYTLRQVAELQLFLVLECRNCRRVSQLDVLGLIERYGTNATLREIRTKGRCRVCKKQTADILMREPESRKNEGWWPRPPRARRD